VLLPRASLSDSIPQLRMLGCIGAESIFPQKQTSA
jgi:hypothetical protein